MKMFKYFSLWQVVTFIRPISNGIDAVVVNSFDNDDEDDIAKTMLNEHAKILNRRY